ncbi:MAG: hypothetical protein COT92_03390 [Candidatus Doudnabacteria bacterium CG10_big_fil_rev_8_21_14_0_10_42_18]|uniref:Queuosine precursor transporter n=1 Tax=Candidatus Doudnabacteria bacterium CG10_big_fil_rev_8_21_14_0_10_42_18 TaxID=1974552 RepID=A0A2H0VA97_9BACT|nr:MAG: hypothetical protein COT92_03390 [Candidatus Doudnabacteria bacterium CG10_big_fil_rev_8_21_14_0_10_42_18]
MSKIKQSFFAWGPIAASAYVAFQLIANVLSTKIAVLPVLGWAIDGGTVIYPLTFTVRDFVHKTLGKKIARQVVITAAILNLLMILLFWLIGKMTPDPSWPFQDAYQNILLPVWRIVIASVIAQVISELIDTEIFSLSYKKFNDIVAVLFSNSVALVVDSFIFSLIAFAGALPWPVVLQIIYTNIIIKMILSIISLPSIKAVPRRVEFEKI